MANNKVTEVKATVAAARTWAAALLLLLLLLAPPTHAMCVNKPASSPSEAAALYRIQQAEQVLNGMTTTTTTTTQHKQREELDLSYMRVCFLPDCGVIDSTRYWYADFYKQEKRRLTSFSPVFLSMPNVYENNSKRYEVEWLRYMRSSLSLDKYDCIIAHGSSAEAMLRFLESDLVPACILLIDANDEYTAGERHGRRFHFENIKRNCPSGIDLLSTSRDSKWAIYNTFTDELLSDKDAAEDPALEAFTTSRRRVLERVTAEMKRLTYRE